jgi:CDP-diacylglycerol--serine O-phosphatidyltransferase
MAAFLYLLCAALRLARFNASKPDIQGQCFIGLATPAAAAVIASIIIAFEDLFGSRVHPGFMVAVVYILAFLMVSNIKYPAFKKFEFRKRVSFTRFLLVVLVLYILATIPKIALFIISFGYTIFGPIGEWSSQKANLNAVSDSIKHPDNNLK